MVTGGAGGMGSIAIQLARAMFGASFVATTASPGAKTDLCIKLGADVVVDYRSDKFEEVRCAVSGVRCTVYGVRCTVHGVRCTVYGVRCTVCGVRCAVYGVRCTVYGVRCAVYGVRCAVCCILIQV